MRISDWSSYEFSSDLDWELNSTAKMLLLNAYMLKREVGAARMQLVAMTSINSKIGGGGGGTKYSEIEPAEPIKGPRHNIDLGELLDAVKDRKSTRLNSSH